MEFIYDHYPNFIAGGFFAAFILALIADWVRVRVVRYVDDNEGKTEGVIFKKIASTFGYERYDGLFYAYENKVTKLRSDGDVIIFLVFGIHAMLCMFLWLFKIFPSVAVGLIVGYAVLYLARFAVRLSKKFKTHISNPDAHK